MKFKKYERQYERVFSDPEKLKKKCDIAEVTAFNNIPGNTTVYLRLFQDTAWKFQMDIFNGMVKFVWLVRRFCYKGKHREKTHRNGLNLEQPYALFLKGHVGMSNRTLFSSNSWIKRITYYFDEFFPNFNSGNPFEEKYEYPFKYMNLDCLLLVSRMPERMSLLEEGEKGRMNYLQFTDYIINYIKCYNEEHGLTWEYYFPTSSFVSIRKAHQKNI